MFYSEADVKQVDVSTTNGSFGILPSHVPTLATLRPGLLTVHDESGATKYFGEYSTICHCAVPEKIPLYLLLRGHRVHRAFAFLLQSIF